MLNIEKLASYCYSYNEHKSLELTRDELTKVLTDLREIDGNIRVGYEDTLNDIDDFVQEAEDCFEDVLEFENAYYNENVTKLDKIYLVYDKDSNLIGVSGRAEDDEIITMADIYD